MATNLVPKGVYRLTEEDKNVIEENVPDDGPVVVPSTLAMGKSENWVHYTRSILKCGRSTAMPVEGDQDPDDTPEVDLDPQEKLLKSIAEDCKARGGAPSWTLRCCGDQQVYGAANPVSPDLNYGVVVVRSNIWPGAYSFFSQGTWSQIYMGNGNKMEVKKTFYPVCPPMMVADPVEKICCVEP